MFASIRAAHINMETYIIEDDAVGNSSPALIEKQVQGVQVNLIYDNVGVINSPKAYFKRLSDSGIKVLEFNPVNLLSTKKGGESARRSFYDELLRAGVKILERRNILLHSKNAVIDGVWSTVGSTNLDWRSFQDNDEVNAVVLGQAFGVQIRCSTLNCHIA